MSTPLVDLHCHSTLSADASSPMADVCAAAVDRGVTWLTFTEHLDLQPDDPGYGFFDYDRYTATLAACRDRFGDRLRLPMSIEVSYQPEFADEIEQFLAKHPFDYVIGSVHSANREFMWLPEFYEKRTAQEAWQLYFEDLRKCAATGWFCTLGHLDVPKRYCSHLYGKFRYADWADLVDAVLQACIDTGTGLEINTSGLRQGYGETLPGIDVLRRYRELGGEILTVGSDSHQADHVAADIPVAYDLAREAGFKAIAVFPERRRPQFIDL